MLTGRPPPAANDGQHPSLRSPRSLRAGIPRDLDGVVTRAMAPEPGKRFQTAADMATALARSAADDDTDPDEVVVVAASPAPAPPRSARVADPLTAPRRRGWLGWALVLVGMAAVAVAVAIVLIQGIGAGRNSPPSTPRQGQTSTTQANGTRLPVFVAHSFDPNGSASPSDPAKQENEKLAHLAIDKDPGTKWQTTRYNDADISRYKEGVGLILELASPAQARSLELDVPTTGAEVTVYGADGASPPDTLADWQPPLADPQEIDENKTVISLNGKSPDRYYLIWFTRLPDSNDGGGGHRGAISEAVLRS
jgi:putative peptidoglycan lipid II flippase